MKVKFYIKSQIVVFAIAFLATKAFSQAPPVTTIGDALCQSDTFDVPVTVSGFTNVANISLTLNYDPSKLSFQGVVLNSSIPTAGTFSTLPLDATGKFKLSHTGSSSITLTDNSVLFTLTFAVIPGAEGETIPLTWSNVQGDCDYAPPIPGYFTPEISPANLSIYFNDGIVTLTPKPVVTGPVSADVDYTGNVYSTQPGMTGYSWDIPAGGIITSPADMYVITVTWVTSGTHTVNVTYTNSNHCTGTSDSLYVTVNKNLTIHTMLEGLFNPGTNMMNEALNASQSPQYGPGIADEITIELHNSTAPFGLVSSIPFVCLHTNGTASLFTDPAYTGSYYIVVKTRNCVETWSATPVSFEGDNLSYNFINSPSNSYGNNVKNMATGIYAIYSGDIDQDGFLSISDMASVDNKSAAFATGYLVEDIDGDSYITVSDMAIIDNNSSKFVTVAKP